MVTLGKYALFGLLLPLVGHTASMAAAVTVEAGRHAERLIKMAPQARVTGKITDGETGDALPAVSIIVKGTTTGTTTDMDGNYAITVDDDATLVFSYIGYETEEVVVGNQSVIDIVLEADMASLDEVVVVGYGTQEKKYVTGSVASVDAEAINKTPIVSADQAIQGRAAGVQISSSQGVPGAPVEIRVRGVGTFGNSQPLIVVDGVPLLNDGPGSLTRNPLAAINPADIASIEILKDASTAAVYGVRAANGVILITTKQGEVGKLRVNVDSYVGLQNYYSKYDWLSTPEYAALAADIVANDGDPATELPIDLQPGSPWLANNTDWQEAFINDRPIIQNHQVSISGGTETATFRVSGGYSKQDATIIGTSLERFSLRVNSEYKLLDRVKIGENLMVSTTKTLTNRFVNGFIGNGSVIDQMSAPPTIPIYDNGPDNYRGFHIVPERNGAVNPIAVSNALDNTNRANRILANAYAEVEIIEGLKYRGNVGVDFDDNIGKQWDRGFSQLIWFNVDRPQNVYQVDRGYSFSLLLESTLSYNRDIGDHHLDAIAGITNQKFYFENMRVQATDFISDDPDFYRSINSGVRQPSTGGYSESALLGYVGRLNYAFKDRYLATFTVRRDGTSRFNPEDNKRWGTFPSFSVGWRLTEEPFMQNVSFLTDLKLKVGWGQLGNQETAAFAHIFRVSTSPDYALGPGRDQAPAVGPAPANFANRDLTWETVETTDIGFEAQFLDGKFGLNATYYQRLTSDILLDVEIPATAGLGRDFAIRALGLGIAQINAAEVFNQGVEIEANYRQIVNDDFTFDVSGNITTVKNEVLSLTSGLEQLTITESRDAIYRTAVGFPIGYFYGYQTDGLYQNASEADGAVDDDLSNGVSPGDIRFVDNNGPGSGDEQFSGQPDDKVSPADRTFLGKTIPDFFYGLTINASYKNLDFSMFWQGVEGVSAFNRVRFQAEQMISPDRNALASTGQRWTGENTSNSFPRAVFGDPNNNRRFSDRWVEDASFLRLKNIQIGYNLTSLLNNNTSAFSNARVYVGLTNLATFTSYSGLDPEIVTARTITDQPGGPGVSLAGGTDGGNIPQPRSFTVGVQLGF